MTETPIILYCANHPDVETSLRCNNCEKPICPKCAVLTPTGYRCKDCVHQQQKVFETAEWFDYPLVFFIVGGLSFLGSLLAAILGILIIFVAAIIGVAIAEATRFIIRRRRSKRLFQTAAAAAVIGSLPLLISQGFGALMNPTLGGTLLGLLWQGIYTFTVTSTVYYRLRGIQIK
jgi:hypothetical protein